MANSFDLDGGEAAAVHHAFDYSTAEAPPHSSTSLPSSSGSDSTVASDNSENGFAVPVEESIRDDVVRDSYIYESVLSAVSVEESEEEKREGVQVKCSGICATEIQVSEHKQLQAIDHHAEVFGPSVIRDGKVNGDERNWTEQEPQKKRAKRRGGKARRNNEVSNCYPTTERREKKGLMYSRDELEALRLEKPEEQKKKWLEIYCRLGPEVMEEFDGLARMNMRREKDNTPIFDFDPRPQFQKPTSLGMIFCFHYCELSSLILGFVLLRTRFLCRGFLNVLFISNLCNIFCSPVLSSA